MNPSDRPNLSTIEPPRAIAVLGTGGTIAGRAEQAGDNVGYTAGAVGVEQLVAELPSSVWPSGWTVRAEQLAQLDSKDMDHDTWWRLALRVDALLADRTVAAVVITHGTDTLEESAVFLSAVLAVTKPVVLVSAMRPVTALSPDGPQNLADALTVARAGVPGVMTVAAGEIHAARSVQKVHPYAAHAFASTDGGLLGCVEEGVVRWWRTPPLEAVMVPVALLPPPPQWPAVAVVMSHAGIDPSWLNPWLLSLPDAGVRGLVVAGTGNGTLHRELEPALNALRDAGLTIWVTTRCALGSLVRAAGAPSASAPLSVRLAPAKARVVLMLSLMAAAQDGRGTAARTRWVDGEALPIGGDGAPA